MTTKHTPGPLVVVDDPARGDWYVIKDVGTGPFKARDHAVAWVFTSEADALLFAAAPDMLDALREAVIDNLSIVYDDGIDGHVRLGCCRAHASQGHAADCWKTKARAAIAKAEGRE